MKKEKIKVFKRNSGVEEAKVPMPDLNSGKMPDFKNNILSYEPMLLQ